MLTVRNWSSSPCCRGFLGNKRLSLLAQVFSPRRGLGEDPRPSPRSQCCLWLSLLVQPLRPFMSPRFPTTLTPPSSNGQSNLRRRYHMYRDHKILCSREGKNTLPAYFTKETSSRKSSYSFHGGIGHPSSLHHLCLQFYAYTQPKSRSALAFLCSFWG